jgi:hypothetical protein
MMASEASVLHNVAMAPQIREAATDDWSDIWPIVREVVLAGDTFAYSPEMTDDEARELWMVAAPGRTTVAVEATRSSEQRTCTQTVPGPGRTWPVQASWWRRPRKAAAWDGRSSRTL